MIRKINFIFRSIFLYLSSFLLSLVIYIKINFKDVIVEQLIYSLQEAKGTSTNAIKMGAIFVLIVSLTIFIILNIPVFLKRICKNKTIFEIAWKNHSFKFVLFPIQKLVYYSIFTLLISIIFSLYYIGAFDYINDLIDVTTLYEDYYVEPKSVDITFPDDKQNLIYIYLESFESTFASKDNGGGEDTSYISSLEDSALDNLNFSNTSKLGGALQLRSVSWTAAAMVGQTAGLPLIVKIDGNSYHGYSKFMPGATSLGEILKDNGYSNYLMMGSDSDFGGRSDYFKEHGNYIIYDYNTSKEDKLIDGDYYKWWGFEDQKLFSYAKDKLTNIASLGEPFNFTMLTADTHFVDGYLDESCDTPFDNHYANVFNCSSLMVSNFISWVQEQDFYDNTTIIISGDHLTMQSDFVNNLDSDYTRTVFNEFINSRITTKNSKNRKFSTMDMFPTTLASLGVNIEGNRLALGTNLFSGEKTLIERVGIDYIQDELDKRSNFYNNYILGDTYKEMLTKDNNK